MCIKYLASSIILAIATSGISAPQAQAFGDPVVGATTSGEFNALPISILSKSRQEHSKPRPQLT